MTKEMKELIDRNYCPTALGTNETITRGVTYCPEGWTVINTDA